MKHQEERRRGEALRVARLETRWSQKEVANRLGVSPVTVNRWEQGVTTPSPYNRIQLCTLFGKSAQHLGLESFEEEVPPTARQEQTPESLVDDPLLPGRHREQGSFIGRHTYLNHIVHTLCTHRAGSYALVGLPGVGKTSLVLEVVQHPQIQQHFRDGILWVGLGPTPQLAEALNRWGVLLGLSTTDPQALTNVDTLARSLHQRIAGRRMILLLDDAWELSHAITFHIGGPHCCHLLTTRFPQLAASFAGEQVSQLDPLTEQESIHLLRQLAPQLDQERSGELVSLTHAVGGLPLALTLMGRYLHRQSLSGSPRRLSIALQQLNENLDARLHLEEPLASWKYNPSYPVGTALSLQRAIESSVHYLPASAQAAFRTLSLFPPKPDSFSEEAFLAACPTSVADLDLLVDSGLVEPCQIGRYQIHQTIADYARLQGSDPEGEQRLVQFVVHFVSAHEHDETALEQDLPMITMAFERAFARELYEPLLQGIFALMPFLEHRFLSGISEQLLEHALQAAYALNSPYHQARCWLYRASIAMNRGEILQAQEAALQGLRIAEQLQHQPAVLAQLLVQAGGALVDTEIGNQAEAYLVAALRLVEQLEDHAPHSMVYRYLGEMADNLGETQKAIRFYQRGLTMAKQSHNWKTAAALLQNLGVHAARRKDFQQAASYYQQGLNYAYEQHDVERQSAILMNLGMMAWEQQQPEVALKLSLESLRLAREIDQQMRISSVLQNLGMMMRVQGQYEQAHIYLQESLQRAERIGHQWLVYETTYEIGMLALRQQQMVQAEQLFEEIRQKAKAIGAQVLIGQAIFGLAQVYEQRGLRTQALSMAQESQEIFEALDHIVYSQEVEQWRAALPSNPMPRDLQE